MLQRIHPSPADQNQVALIGAIPMLPKHVVDAVRASRLPTRRIPEVSRSSRWASSRKWASGRWRRSISMTPKLTRYRQNRHPDRFVERYQGLILVDDGQLDPALPPSRHRIGCVQARRASAGSGQHRPRQPIGRPARQLFTRHFSPLRKMRYTRGSWEPPCSESSGNYQDAGPGLSSSMTRWATDLVNNAWHFAT